MNDPVNKGGGVKEPLASAFCVLTFRTQGQVYALPVTAVDQLIEMVAINPIPEAPPAIQGVINVHGEIVPVLDLRLRLGLPFKPYQLRTPIILMQANGRSLALVVDEVDTVIELNPTDIQTSNSVFDFPAAESLLQTSYFTAIAKVNKQIIIILDADCLVSNQLATDLPQWFAPQNSKLIPEAESKKERLGV